MLWNSKWFPGTNLQDINLDWILKKVSALRGGSTGQYLYKKSDKDFDFGWKTGGGGGGSSDYLDLDNKPSINNVELIGNKNAADLGLAASSDIPEIPVQSVNGKTGVVVLSASDVGAYVKPATGIPKTDLSSAVQESLDKADTAYSKPATGIPKTDLSNDVQTSLNKADTALQAVPPTYRTANAQDTIDAAQNTQIDARAKADEIAIVITGARPALAVSVGQYVIVRNSTISGISDGLYTANDALSPSANVTAANLTGASNGGLNSLQQSKMDKVVLTAGTTWNFYSCYGYTDDGKTITLNIPVTTQVPVTTSIVLTRCQGSLRSSNGNIVGGFSFNYLPYVTTSSIYSSGRGINIILNKSDGFGITGMSIICGFISLSFQDDL